MKDTHAYGTCINIVLRIGKLEAAFSVGKRDSDVRLEGFGEA